MAGAILDKVYHSMDGGKTWGVQQLSSTYGVFGDPVILCDNKGQFFYAHLADPSGRGRAGRSWLDRIVVQKSLDGGETWNNGSFAGLRPPADQDKHWLIADPVNHSIYMTWTEFDKYGSARLDDESRILFAKSVDGAESWSDAMAINELMGNCLDDDKTTEGAVPAVGPSGEIYVAWSFDGHIYFDRSTDMGETWMDHDIKVCEQIGGWTIDIPGLTRANGMPVTACDLSDSEYRGTLYINYCDQSNGSDDTDVWLVKSSDGGHSWSRPFRVNDDTTGRHQFFSWMTVDQKTGAIYIVFYDRRNHSDTGTDVYMAASRDGGETFVNMKISERSFYPTTEIFFGDYNNINAYDGVVRPIWTRMDNGKTSIWTALINF